MQTRKTRKTLSITAAAISAPLLLGTAVPATAATGTPATSVQASETARTVPNPCADTCEETSRTSVKHKTLGDVDVVTYSKDVGRPGAAPSEVLPAYAVIRDGETIGFVQGAHTDVHFAPGQIFAGHSWSVENGTTNMDRYGNIYVAHGTGITVISQTEDGFDSNGTMPDDTANPDAHPFNGQASLRIDPDGEPTITVADYGKDPVVYTWQDGAFAPKK